MIHIWFLIGLELIVWWQTLANVQIMFLGLNIDNSKITFMIENKRGKSRSEVKLLGIAMDHKLAFTTHIENLCSTASNRLWLLARIRTFLSFEQATRLPQAYIISTFTYWPLIWIFCIKTANSLINKIHKRNLRVIYKMEDANFEDLLRIALGLFMKTIFTYCNLRSISL